MVKVENLIKNTPSRLHHTPMQRPINKPINNNPPLKTEILSSPTFENLVRGSILPPAERGMHTMIIPNISGDTAYERIL